MLSKKKLNKANTYGALRLKTTLTSLIDGHPGGMHKDSDCRLGLEHLAVMSSMRKIVFAVVFKSGRLRQ